MTEFMDDLKVCDICGEAKPPRKMMKDKKCRACHAKAKRVHGYRGKRPERRFTTPPGYELAPVNIMADGHILEPDGMPPLLRHPETKQAVIRRYEQGGRYLMALKVG